jgi:hypothetical protein
MSLPASPLSTSSSATLSKVTPLSASDDPQV